MIEKSEKQSTENIFKFSTYAVSRCDSGNSTCARLSLRDGT